MRLSFDSLLTRRRRTALTRCVLIGIALLFVIPRGAAADATDRRIKFKAGQTKARVKGKFTKSVTELRFVMNARIGQHMRVKIVPVATRLITAGEVISPAGKLDGGPGGVIYDADLTESGDYRIRVFQRQNKVVGTFYLEVEIR